MKTNKSSSDAKGIGIWIENTTDTKKNQQSSGVFNFLSEKVDFQKKGKDVLKNEKFQIHINYWSLGESSSSKSIIEYLDIGILLRSVSEDEKICVFIPFLVDGNNFTDLGDLVLQDENLIEKIFNSSVKNQDRNVAHNKINCAKKIFFDDGDCFIFFNGLWLSNSTKSKFGDCCKIPVETNMQGTKLSFIVKDFFSLISSPNHTENFYFRFRIRLDENTREKFSSKRELKDNRLLSRRDTMEIVDFRINETRSLPNDVGVFNTRSHKGVVHFFLVREIDSDYYFSHTNFRRTRLLEKKEWSNYLSLEGDDFFDNQFIIYHWRQELEGKNDHFHAFAKFKKTHTGSNQIVTFLAIVFLLGLFSGMAANALGSILSIAVGDWFLWFERVICILIVMTIIYAGAYFLGIDYYKKIFEKIVGVFLYIQTVSIVLFYDPLKHFFSRLRK